MHQTFPNNPSVTDGIDGVETGMESVRALNMEADNKGLLAQHVMGDHHFVRLIGEYL